MKKSVLFLLSCLLLCGAARATTAICKINDEANLSEKEVTVDSNSSVQVYQKTTTWDEDRVYQIYSQPILEQQGDSQLEVFQISGFVKGKQQLIGISNASPNNPKMTDYDAGLSIDCKIKR